MTTASKKKILKNQTEKTRAEKKNKQKAILELSKLINKSMTRKYLEIYLK